jgi:Predicted AAA-ATPase/PD-(D/E)XK nuclease superfamily
VKDRKKLPIGIQDFQEIITKGFIYIDKTQQIHKLISEGKYYFLSRPRRFGKSLTLSTIKEIFKGSKALFKDLWIENKWDWTETNPVIHVYFEAMGYKDLGLEKAIEHFIENQALIYEVSLTSSGIAQKFQELLEKIHTKYGKQVVILIDEYDKPLIDYLEDIPTAKEHQQILKAFYSTFKSSDEHIRLLLITGVSQFSKVSIFSDLNNLLEISQNHSYPDIVGYTQAELDHYFTDRMILAAEENELSLEQLRDKIKLWYNGYTWNGKTAIYNPFSILCYFTDYQFVNHWFKTGTPTFLIKLLKERMFYDLSDVQVTEDAFESYELDKLETIPLLHQTGYLTIKHIDKNLGLYTLDYPNKEVKDSLLRYLMDAFSYKKSKESAPLVLKMIQAFTAQNIAEVIEILKSIFATIPYPIFIANKEAYYHSIVHLVFTYLGQNIESEVNTSRGRMDIVVQTATHIYILEFKLDQSADIAFAQIIEKDYAAKFRHIGKPIVGIGINFTSEQKTIEAWVMKEI